MFMLERKDLLDQKVGHGIECSRSLKRGELLRKRNAPEPQPKRPTSIMATGRSLKRQAQRMVYSAGRVQPPTCMAWMSLTRGFSKCDDLHRLLERRNPSYVAIHGRSSTNA
jgi:hypothetical protein